MFNGYLKNPSDRDGEYEGKDPENHFVDYISE
jgi:hypothetical protein